MARNPDGELGVLCPNHEPPATQATQVYVPVWMAFLGKSPEMKFMPQQEIMILRSKKNKCRICWFRPFHFIGRMFQYRTEDHSIHFLQTEVSAGVRCGTSEHLLCHRDLLRHSEDTYAAAFNWIVVVVVVFGLT